MRTDSQSNGLAERGRVLLRRAAVVAVVQAADQWNGDDAAQRGWRDRPRVRRVLRQREMRSRLVVYVKYRLKTRTNPVSFTTIT
jgi:hypothetical protein